MKRWSGKGPVLSILATERGTPMREAFLDFVREPSKESFLRVREAVLFDPNYDGYSNDLSELDTCLQQEDFPRFQRLARNVSANLLLSPRFHLLAAVAARKQGDEKSASAEFYLCQCCVEGILSTGDGSAEQPYLVLRTSDEYDVLMHFQKQLAMQKLMHQDSRSFDVLQCQDGTEYWFDITDMFRSMERRFQGELPEA
jgi:hypothetical protein